MKKLLLGLIFLLIPSSAYASTTSSTVINNVSASSTNSDSQMSSHTEITTETDGKVTHYESDEPNKSIHVESTNGTSKIEVNGEEVSGDDKTISPTKDKVPTPTNSNSQKQVVKSVGILQKLIDRFERPFKIIFVLLHLER